MSGTSLASHTYARALLQASGSSAATVAGELDSLVQLAAESPASWDELTRPGIATGVLKSTIDKLFAGAEPTTRNVLKVLVDHGRLGEALDVAHEFRRLVREQSRQLDVHVTTAVELAPELRAKLEQRLSASTGQTVTLHASVDPEIIGGLVVRHGDTLVDTSLRGRLEQLKLELSRPHGGSSSSPSDASDTKK